MPPGQLCQEWRWRSLRHDGHSFKHAGSCHYISVGVCARILLFSLSG
jgi:hypothetical protein